MKNIVTLSVVFAFCFTASAKVITVNNNANAPGQYSSLQQAIDSASAGDTIYVHGSATSYGNVNIKKRLNFFGTGNMPNKVNTLVSEVGTFQLDTLSGVSGATGTKICGFKVKDIKGYAGSGGTKDVTISRNYFTAGAVKVNITGKGWILENNIVLAGFVTVNNNSTLVVRNNIFSSSYLSTSNQPTVIITNNDFFGGSYSLSNMSNALITNNIFSGPTPNGSNVNNNVFSNNITYQTTNNTIPNGTNTGTGNLSGQDPKFMNVPTNTFNYSYNFALDTISPCINAGTDGKDMGIYGGNAPMVDLTGAPPIPQVKSVTILNPVITVGDTLQVIIKANKQN